MSTRQEDARGEILSGRVSVAKWTTLSAPQEKASGEILNEKVSAAKVDHFVNLTGKGQW